MSEEIAVDENIKPKSEQAMTFDPYSKKWHPAGYPEEDGEKE